MKKLTDEGTAYSVTMYEVSPEVLRRIAERLEQQARDYAQPGQEIIFAAAEGLIFKYRNEKQSSLQNATV